MMKKGGGGEPIGEIASAIQRDFGPFSVFQEKFSDAAATVFGSGWVWLALSEVEGLVIVTTPNQDSPISHGQIPLLGLDVWEHAYYLKYQNRRSEYIENWWQVVNWDQIEINFSSSKK